ncbi:hypothetical protein [Acidithiobacillus caldus]|uniref:hypothetical protein n=1 Tax=Acidithiobacillus caldus TaxID=33059 RepID=UPI001D019455|nr:hypothetical protein [Acidithiobacillus caldus]
MSSPVPEGGNSPAMGVPPSAPLRRAKLPSAGPVALPSAGPDKPVYASSVKLVGPYAQRIRDEVRQGQARSINQLVAKYAVLGMELSRAPDASLRALEMRLLGGQEKLLDRIDGVQAEVDTLTAMFDLFTKLMLLHLPEPVLDEAEAVQSSALTRYERFLRQVAAQGFDANRPRALRRIAKLLTERMDAEAKEAGR